MQKIFLETSFFNFLDTLDSPVKMAETVGLFEILKNNDETRLFSSRSVITEILRCYEPKRTFMLNKMADICEKIFNVTSLERNLAKEYMDNGVLTPSSYSDLIHVATAVLNDCPLILSWNMKHLSNMKTVFRVNEINVKKNLPLVQILTPIRYLEEQNNE